jgi:hypothetical protein
MARIPYNSMVLDESMKLLKGWKHPLFVRDLFFRAPELIDTLVDHGVPRELIRDSDKDETEPFDFIAVMRPNPKDYDEIVIFLILSQDRDEEGRIACRSLSEVMHIRIVHSEWYKRKESK